MQDIALARALHVIGVVLWIGGVAMVTMVLLPAVRKVKTGEDRVALFEELERRFAMQARVTTLVTGASGLYLVHRLGLWPRFSAAEFWWMHAMVAVWLAFTLVLFVLEPLVLHPRYKQLASTDDERALRQVARFHWIALLSHLSRLPELRPAATGCYSDVRVSHPENSPDLREILTCFKPLGLGDIQSVLDALLLASQQLHVA